MKAITPSNFFPFLLSTEKKNSPEQDILDLTKKSIQIFEKRSLIIPFASAKLNSPHSKIIRFYLKLSTSAPCYTMTHISIDWQYAPEKRTGYLVPKMISPSLSTSFSFGKNPKSFSPLELAQWRHLLGKKK